MNKKPLFLATIMLSCIVFQAEASATKFERKTKQYGQAALYAGGFVFMGLAACGGIIKLMLDVDKMKRNGLTKDTLLNTFIAQSTVAAEAALWSGVAYYACLQALYFAQKAHQTLKK